MRIRTKEDLIDRLAEMSKRRRRELITLRELVLSGRPHEKSVHMRCAVVLSYAHWEGFVKDSSLAYLMYIYNRGPLFCHLAPNFQAIVCRPKVIQAGKATKKIKPHLEVVTQIFDCATTKAEFDFTTAIDTESNLDAEVFENICLTIGLQYDRQWSTYGPFFDDLFRTRCIIAHGELFIPDEPYVHEIIKRIIESITSFRTDIENAAINDDFLRH